jgi:hypothetical protein
MNTEEFLDELKSVTKLLLDEVSLKQLLTLRDSLTSMMKQSTFLSDV